VRAWDNPEVEVRADVGAGVDRIDTTSDHGRVSIKSSCQSLIPQCYGRICISAFPAAAILISRESAQMLNTNGCGGSAAAEDSQWQRQGDVFPEKIRRSRLSAGTWCCGTQEGAGAAEINVSTISGNVG